MKCIVVLDPAFVRDIRAEKEKLEALGFTVIIAPVAAVHVVQIAE